MNQFTIYNLHDSYLQLKHAPKKNLRRRRARRLAAALGLGGMARARKRSSGSGWCWWPRAEEKKEKKTMFGPSAKEKKDKKEKKIACICGLITADIAFNDFNFREINGREQLGGYFGIFIYVNKLS